MVCVSEPTFPGCLSVVKPLALFRMEDDQGIDDKSLDEVPDQLQSEIAHFFTVYKQLENKHVEIEGWYSRTTSSRT
jgi:inorganic pyrophosphatase